MTKVSNALQALGPFGPLERTCQYSTVPAGRFMVGVYNVLGALMVSFTRRAVKILLVDT